MERGGERRGSEGGREMGRGGQGRVDGAVGIWLERLI